MQGLRCARRSRAPRDERRTQATDGGRRRNVNWSLVAMSESQVTLESALTLEAGAGDVCRAQIGADWAQGRAVFGGLVAGLMARALERLLPAERSLRSCVVDFVGPGAPGEATIEVNVLRAGRALTHAEARLIQNGELCAIM